MNPLLPNKATRAMEAAAEKYWNERRFKALSKDPRTWAGVWEAMANAYREEYKCQDSQTPTSEIA